MFDMIDWFVLLAPVLLAPLVSLFAFLGCKPGRIGSPPPDPNVTMSLFFPFPAEVDEATADLRWRVSGRDMGPVTLSGRSTDGGEIFDHVEEPPEPGRWVIWCSFFTRKDGATRAWGEAQCGPFSVAESDVVEVRFRIEHISGPGTYRVVREACPAD